MKYSKEVIYNFTCEKCSNWWSYSASGDLTYINDKTWTCPHCQHEHNPPHYNELEAKRSFIAGQMKVN